MGLKAALGQLAVVAIALTGCVLYTLHHNSTLERADFSALEYIEDSKEGNGTRYRVLARAADSGGQSFTVEVLSRAGVRGFLPDLSASTPEHMHSQGQVEQLTVIEGRLGYMLKGNSSRGELGPGEKLTIPAGTQHAIFNADNTTDLLYTLSHSPAGPMGEAFFENLAGLGWDYGSLDRMHPLQVLVVFDGSGTKLADLGGILAPVVDKVLVPVSHFLGFKADYPSHRSKGAAAVGDAAHSSSSSSSSSSRGEL